MTIIHPMIGDHLVFENMKQLYNAKNDAIVYKGKERPKGFIWQRLVPLKTWTRGVHLRNSLHLPRKIAKDREDTKDQTSRPQVRFEGKL